MRAVRINRLQRHFRQRFLRQSQCLPVTLNQILTFAAIAFGNRALQLNQGAIARKNMRQVEESHLHDGIDAGAKSTFAGDFRRVNHVKTRLFLIQHRLNFLRQTRPDLVGAVRRIKQKDTAGLQTLRHLIFIDKL